MFNYLIIAYGSKNKKGNLFDATEIQIFAKNNEEALEKAKMILIAPHYHIKYIIEQDKNKNKFLTDFIEAIKKN